jgi:hypothetical protein
MAAVICRIQKARQPAEHYQCERNAKDESHGLQLREEVT